MLASIFILQGIDSLLHPDTKAPAAEKVVRPLAERVPAVPDQVEQAVRLNGAVIVWPSPDTNPAPPPDIKARFPSLVPEVPHAFARPVRGRLPPLLVGWGVVRPADAATH